MITLNTHTSLRPGNRILKIDLSNTIPDGEYDVLIVLEEKTQKEPLTFAKHNISITQNQTFGREDIYGEDFKLIVFNP
jgi:hypothetical protein